MPDDWKKLVKKARNSDRDFEELISRIEPLFWVIASHLGSGLLIDDLVQLARIKVWESLSVVKFNRPETIKQFLITVGINAMRDNMRRERQKRVCNFDSVDERVLAVPAKPDKLFRGLLLEYEYYIRRTGRFQGAHKRLAQKYGISLWAMRLRFHKAVGRFLKGLNK